MPGTWTKIKIEVRGEQARLYVHDNEQPTLIVKDVKSGANGHGGVALWLEPGTVAHFRNLTVEPLMAPSSDEASSTPAESVRNSVGMQLKVAEENTQPTLRIVLPGHPPSDRAIEIIFHRHAFPRPSLGGCKFQPQHRQRVEQPGVDLSARGSPRGIVTGWGGDIGNQALGRPRLA